MPEFQSEHGDYPGMFERMLSERCGSLQFSSYAVNDGELPEVDACDAYLITGSRHSVYDDLPWIRELAGFVGKSLEAKRKIIGICFGHQLITHFFGGETGATYAGWGVGVQASRVEGGESWMQPPRADFSLLCSHKDQVIRPPEGARIFATSDYCPCAGFVWNDLVLTFQGHPEFTKSYSAALMKMREELLGEDIYSRGMASLIEDTHEHIVASWIVNFLANS